MPRKPTTADARRAIAARIDAHVRRFEADKTINVPQRDGGPHPYYGASAWYAPPYIRVMFVRYQGHIRMTEKDATAYADWLDAGGTGRPPRNAPAVAGGDVKS